MELIGKRAGECIIPKSENRFFTRYTDLLCVALWPYQAMVKDF